MRRPSTIGSLVVALVLLAGAGLPGMADATTAGVAGTLSEPIRISTQSLGRSEDIASALKIFLVLTALSFIPAALICMSSFVRIVVVLSMLRHALGLQDTPPNMVLTSLALFLCVFTMMPVASEVQQRAIEPFNAGSLDLAQATEAGLEPIKDFMVRQTREEDLALMVELARAEMPTSLEDTHLTHLIPAFLISELRTAFQVGFIIFLPFLLIDIVVSSVLMALGMMMVSPASIAIPIKVLLFVLIDGWHIVVRALMGTFA